ncbi:MAG TPA: nucleotidyltransferase family protein [Thermoanaerobaculia bacterium]|jgi:molybdenum cofactor cytidylyltransferase|nr:nucleotidyltransferase family protein [Thermoanaerobaculia bacterium]
MPPDREGPVAGVLLAAGTSSRMGSNKLLFELDGETVLRRAAKRILAGGVSPLVVVLGHQAEKAARELEGLPCEQVLNPSYEQGINSSLKSGITAVQGGEATAALVMLADMPYVTPEMIAAMIDRYRTTEAPLVISDYDGVNAPPMVYDRSLFSELLTMTGEGCGRQVVKRHKSEAEILPWPVAALADLDVPEDYERVQGTRGGP